MKKVLVSLFLMIFILNQGIGQTWQKIDLSLSSSFVNGIFFEDTGYVINENGYIFYTDNFFESWKIDSNYKGSFHHTIAFPNRTIGYITSLQVPSGILKTTDGGVNWNPLANTSNFNVGDVVEFTTEDTAYSGYFSSNYLMKTQNGGIAWSQFGIGNIGGVYQIKFLNDSVGYILSTGLSGLEIYYTHNYGNAWSLVNMLFAISGPADFDFLDDTTVLLVANNLVLKSTNSCDSFKTVLSLNNSAVGHYAHAISFFTHDTGFVAIGNSVYVTYDSGENWIRTNFHFDESYANEIEFICAISAHKIIVGCRNGNIYKTETGGGIWSDISTEKTETTFFTLTPNPASTTLTIITTQPKPNTTLQLFSIEGKQIQQTPITQTTQTIDISMLPAGLYFAVLQNERGRVVRRVVKQ